jgi:hypothetical protein
VLATGIQAATKRDDIRHSKPGVTAGFLLVVAPFLKKSKGFLAGDCPVI